MVGVIIDALQKVGEVLDVLQKVGVIRCSPEGTEDVKNSINPVLERSRAASRIIM